MTLHTPLTNRPLPDHAKVARSECPQVLLQFSRIKFGRRVFHNGAKAPPEGVFRAEPRLLRCLLRFPSRCKSPFYLPTAALS